MIDAQMIQLKERIDAAIQLIRSLKEENKSLKDDLFSTHSQMNRLQTEVSQCPPCGLFAHLRVRASVRRVYMNELDVGSVFRSLRMSQ